MRKYGFTFLVWVLFILECSGSVCLTGILDGTLYGGKPKVIELFISGTEDLGAYEIWRSQNGDPWGAGMGSRILLNGIYSNTFVFLVKYDQVADFHIVFGDTGIYANVIPLGIVSGNGNEGFQIRDTLTWSVTDQIWLEDPTETYRDSYWYRKSGTGPDGGWLVENWYSPGNDALDDLDTLELRAAVPFGSYEIAWNGMDTDWNNSDNWTSGTVPGPQVNVLIRDLSENYPLITNLASSPAGCMNLRILPGASLSIEPGRALTVSGKLIIGDSTEGIPPGELILNSAPDESSPASLLLMYESSGTIIAQRAIPKDDRWHFISSPLSGQKVQPDFATDPPDQTFDLYSWDESSPLEFAWTNIRNADGSLNPGFDTVFIPGRAYLFSCSEVNEGDLIRSFQGPAVTGDISIPLSYSSNYWNLIGNPYSCSLDWTSDGIDKSLIAGSAFHIWDPSLNDGMGGYRTHNGLFGVPAGSSSLIPPMNGFFIQALDAGYLNIDCGNGHPLVHGEQAFYKKGIQLPDNRIRLKISANGMTDETLIYFDSLASNGFDPLYDVVKLSGGSGKTPQISSLSDPDHELVIQAISGLPLTISLRLFCPEGGQSKITAFDMEEMKLRDIQLEDRTEGIWTDLQTQKVYSFFASPGHENNRFYLHLGNALGENEDVIHSDVQLSVSGTKVYIDNNTLRNISFSIMTIEGKILEGDDIQPGRSVIDIHTYTPGMYIISCCTGKHNINHKIIIL